MTIPIPALLLAAQLATPAADRVPQFNLEPTCRGAADASEMTRSSKDACLEKEKKARDDLSQQWASFAAADRARCTTGTAAGGIPSYIELLTCLEMAKQARELPAESKKTTTGSASSGDKTPAR